MKNVGLTLILCALFISLSSAGTFELNDYPFNGETILSLRTTLLQPEDLTFIYPDSYSYFSMNTTLKQMDSSVNTVGVFEVVLFHSIVYDYMGSTQNLFGVRQYCCSAEMAALGRCIYNRFNLNYPPGDAGDGYVHHFVFEHEGDSDLSVVINNFTVSHRGTWYAFFVNCEQTNNFYWNGELTWKNPYGHLDADSVALIPINWILAFAYLMLLVLWIARSIKFRKGLMTIQILITIVLVFGLSEHILWGADKTIYNSVGTVSAFFSIIGSLASALKESGVRLVVLLVALGYSITKPSLYTKTKAGVALLTVLYCVSETFYYYLLSFQSAGMVIDSFYVYLFIFLTFLFNSLFVIWIGYSAHTTMRNLMKRKEVVKYTMYRNLSMILCSSLVISVVFWLSQTFIESSGAKDSVYSIWWIFDAYWNFLYYIIIAYICRIWRPKMDNTRYAFLENEDISMEEQERPKRRRRRRNVDLDETASSSSELEDLSVMTLDDTQPRTTESSSSLVASSSD
eukprot:TRINITY_DN10759_c0_g1_i1.p1 TRINITY_DN10759_c0_g1~~TRINITY_DN10759_c0_g1_i1.p1  ORF type:complete len:512 (-),score=69.04 TRINITY_DN10759_c0_g1_i1:33-1568(-)